TSVYRQDNDLVRFIYEREDATKGRTTAVARIRPYSRPLLQRELLELARCIKFRADGTPAPADIPKEVLEMVLTSASPRFAELAGVIETPTLRPDGSLLTAPGYDPATGLMLVNPPPMLPLPERPTRADAVTALTLLEDLLVQFPFADEASRSVGLSMLITPVVRAALAHAPLHATTAPDSGHGKSYLQELAGYIASGRPLAALGGASL